jgi:mono/diheme cytochrome c family protein
MKIGGKRATYLLVAAVAGGVGVAVWQLAAPPSGTVRVKVPSLSTLAEAGKAAFDASCAQCHGQNAAGTDKGPPFIHDIYNPGHHSDAAFVAAARRGVRQHHWQYGNMPPQPEVTDEEIAAIIQYVRELQRANGILDRPHTM